MSWSVMAATQESDHTFSAVSIMSMIVYIGRIIPIMATGAPMPVINDMVRKKHPIGTPAFPMADTTEITSHSSIDPKEMGIPPFCITNKEVTRMNAAQPFMFIVVQMGSTKRATFDLTPNLFSAVSIVTGNVAAELLVNNAINTAGIILAKVCTGLSPLESRNNGRTTKNCRQLPPIITNTYLPSDSIATPADTCDANCSAKATMPTGNVHISQCISLNNSSCNPCRAFTTISMPSVLLMFAKAKPTAKAIKTSDKTLPSRKGRTMLFGTIDRKWSLKEKPLLHTTPIPPKLPRM